MSEACEEVKLDGIKDVEFRLARAMSHPLRIEILDVLAMRDAAAVDLVPVLGATVGRLDYHMKILAQLKLIEKVKRVPVRGATKVVYKSVVEMFLDEAMWAQLSPRTRVLITEAGIRSILDKAERAIHAKTFDSRSDRHLTGVTRRLDEAAWTEAAAMLMESYERFHALADESSARVGERDTRFSVTLAQLLFESPPPKNSDTKAD